MNAKTEDQPQSGEDKFFGVKTSIEDMLPKADEKAKPEETTIEIEDDDGGVITPAAAPVVVDKSAAEGEDDEELAEYGEKVQKRIKHLTWQAKEAERETAKATTLKDEAVRYAQQVNQQNQQQAQVIATGEANLVNQIKNRATLAVEAARTTLKAYYEEGDTDKIIESQESLNLAQAELLEANRYEGEYKQRTAWQQQQQQQPAGQQAQQPAQQAAAAPAAPPKPSEESQTWATDNPWFGDNKHRDMTALAYATHERLIRDEKMNPNSPEYYEKIDQEVQKRFPEYFEAAGQGQSHSAASRPTTVVASGSRNNGAKPRTVRLKPSQVALAKTLGLTVQQYAEQVLKGAR